MKVVMVSKACVVGTYQTKLEAIASHPDIDLTVIVPPSWDEAGGHSLEMMHTAGYELLVEPIRFNGKHHLHYYPHLRQRLQERQPDIVHMDEEPYSLVTWLGMRHARSVGAKTLFFSWQNIFRRYPPPFRWMEQQVLAWSDAGIAGNADAAEIWQRKGFEHPLPIIPQFGVSLALFQDEHKHEEHEEEEAVFTLGAAGRLIPAKGIDLLFHAAARLEGAWRICIAGDGPERSALEQLAQSLEIADRVEFIGKIASDQMPAFFNKCSVLVVPSRSTPTWKEQFGRIMIEAMACGCPVVGSDSGEIPNVIADAGLIFPEDDIDQLHQQLRKLQQSAKLRGEFGRKGRKRVTEHYSQVQIAQKIVNVYRKMCPLV